MKHPIILFSYFITDRKKCFLTVLVPLVVVACSDVNTSDVGLSPDIQQGVVIPDAVRRVALDVEGPLTADLYCGANSTGISMMISDEVAQGTCENMSTAVSHEIRVEFLFDSEKFSRTYSLAEAIGVATFGPDETVIFFEFDSYVYADNDGDGITNYQELLDGTDPAIPPCKFGQSRLGQCVL